MENYPKSDLNLSPKELGAGALSLLEQQSVLDQYPGLPAAIKDFTELDSNVEPALLGSRGGTQKMMVRSNDEEKLIWLKPESRGHTEEFVAKVKRELAVPGYAVKAYGDDESSFTDFILMEDVEGAELAAVLKDETMDIERKAAIMKSLGHSLAITALLGTTDHKNEHYLVSADDEVTRIDYQEVFSVINTARTQFDMELDWLDSILVKLPRSQARVYVPAVTAGLRETLQNAQDKRQALLAIKQEFVTVVPRYDLYEKNGFLENTLTLGAEYFVDIFKKRFSYVDAPSTQIE